VSSDENGKIVAAKKDIVNKDNRSLRTLFGTILYLIPIKLPFFTPNKRSFTNRTNF